MSELPKCPYCGAILWEGSVKHIEEGVKLICDSCARSYVYIPGYGSFATSDLDPDEQFDISATTSFPEIDELYDSKDVSLAKACFTLCCLLSSIPIVLIMVIMVLFSLF